MELIERSFHPQGSPEWFAERLGKFTSSECHKLLIESRTKGETFGQGAKTYIYEKLNELVTGQVVNNDLSYKDAIMWGHAYEPDAVEFYSEKTGNEVMPCGFEQCVETNFTEMFGGSPDGKIYNKAIIEVKCPFVGANHMFNLSLNNQLEFAKAYPKYYAQVQGNLFATGYELCDFISFDPRPQHHFNRIKIIRISRDTALIEEIKVKVDMAFTMLINHFEKAVLNAEGFDDYMQSLKIAA